MQYTTFLVLTIFLIVHVNAVQDVNESVWGYECLNSRCIKTRINTISTTEAVSLQVCKVFCGTDIGTLWPKPTGAVNLKNVMAKIDVNSITLSASNYKDQTRFWDENRDRLLKQIKSKLPRKAQVDGGKSVRIDILVESNDSVLTMNTNESYKIVGVDRSDAVDVKIESPSIFGARHALETLSQLVVFDDIRRELQIVADFDIADEPVFKHRGLLLDTSRNFFSVESIKRTIDAMGMVKLNTFHWHITDSQSFPLVLKSHPEFSRLGAYSPDKVYTADDISEILDYAQVRGVRIIPEFDAPAHVGEGWQGKNLTVCFNYQPWQRYCVEPPCGQLDPSQDELYSVLEDIYREIMEMFRHPDVFHMGGDEVSHSCWNASVELKTWMTKQGWGHEEVDFMKLWGHFQNNALERVDKITQKMMPIIMWTSRLTDIPYVEQYLDNSRYIIQIWTTGGDIKIQDLLQRGYNLIISNYDALYFDCGYGSWVGEGTNWCSPYIGWEKVYKNDLGIIAGPYKSQILGGEAALWSEQADEQVLDGRFWPRASALAERLWSDPTNSWRDAEPRMLIHRDRLVENGIAAEGLQPKWCIQHEGDCPLSSY